MKRKGTSVIELLVAIAIITIGFFAVIRAVVMAGKETAQLTHTNEARQIAKIHIDRDEALAKKYFSSIQSSTWEFENSKPYYTNLNLKLTKMYFVAEDISYVVFEQTSNPTIDESYKIRPMIDLNNDGADDYTGQGHDMKKVVITVTWPERTAVLTKTQILNALLSNNENFKSKYRMVTFKMSSVISSFEPMDKSCCDNPTLSDIEVLTTDGKGIDIKTTPLDVSTEYLVRIGLNDQCVSKLPALTLLYWYYGEDKSNARSIPMKYAGNLNYYIGVIPGSEVINADIASGYAGSYTCSEEEGAVEPFDMSLLVYAKDDYIGNKCSNTVRETYSDTFFVNVADDEVPVILDYSSRVVAQSCLGLIIAKISDGSNGVSGIAEEHAYWGQMDAGGNIGTLQEITTKTGPDGEGNFFWTLPQSALIDSSGGGTFDDLPDIFYQVTASDYCGNSVSTPIDIGIEKPTTIKITETDINPPLIYPDYSGLGFEDCVPYGERQIPIGFTVIDECQLINAGFSRISKDTGATTGTWTWASLTTNYKHISYSLLPPSRNDMEFRMFATDSSNLKNWEPSLEEGPNIIHQSNALFYPTPSADPYASGEVALEGGYNDTVAISLTNYRTGDFYLYSLNIEDPAYKSVCLSTGDTSVAFPYIDRVVLETQASDGSNYKRNTIWYWENGEPNPGSRKRAPIEIFFDPDDQDKLLIDGFETEATLYLHFMDRPTDEPFAAQPFAMDEVEYNLTINANPEKDYPCNTHLEFNTKTTGYNYPPVANAGKDNFGTVGSAIYFEGRSSVDCDNTRAELSYYWDFGDGDAAYGATAWHTYDNTFYSTKKTEQGITDTSPVSIDVTLTVADPSNASDTDLCKINLYPSQTLLEICDNGVDDDGDTLVDCFDPDCTMAANCNTAITEICDNGIDDDGDTYVDCDDPDCSSAGNCVSFPPNIDSFICSFVEGTLMRFDIIVSDQDDTVFNYSIDWGDGSADTYNDDNTLTATHSFPKNTAQIFTITVMVWDSSGNIDTATANVGCGGHGANNFCSCQ